MAQQAFHWKWREAQELSANQSLRRAKLQSKKKRAIVAAIAEQLRPSMDDLELKSEKELQNAALDTRVKLIDPNDDGTPEVIAQSMVGCSPTGNCICWVFGRRPIGYGLLLEGECQTFTIQKASTHGYRDLVFGTHGSAFDQGLTEYRYESGRYREQGCYAATWRVLEGDTERDLKEPRLTRCGPQ